MQLGEWFGLGGIVVGLVGLYSYRHNKIQGYLAEPDYREKRIEELRQPEAFVLYHNWLLKGLAWVAGIWGEERWHAKSFLTCFYFSFLYSIVLFFISWVLGGSGKIGTVQFLPPEMTGWQRWGLFIAMGVYVYCACQIPKLKFAGWIKDILLSLSIAGPTAVVKFGAFAGAFAEVFAIPVALAVAIVVAGAILVVVAVALAVVVGLTGAGAYAVAYAGAVAVALAVYYLSFKAIAGQRWASFILFPFLGFLLIAVAFGLVSGNNLNISAISFYMFLFALPLVNSLWDGLSMGVSRWLVEQLGRDRNMNKIFWHIVADLFIALILLLALTITLVGGVEAFNQLTVLNGYGAPLSLTSLLNQAQVLPWSPESLWITLMLLSTLFPTFAHLVVAWAGLFTTWLSVESFQGYVKNLEAYGLAIERGVTEKPTSLLHKPAQYFALRWPLAVVANLIFFWGLFKIFEVGGAPLSDGLFFIADETINIVRSFF